MHRFGALLLLSNAARISVCDFGFPFDQIFGNHGADRVIPISSPRDPNGGCDDDYQTLLPGHVLKRDLHTLDCFQINVPANLAAVAIEIDDKSDTDLLRVRVGRHRDNFPLQFDQDLSSSMEEVGPRKMLVLDEPAAGGLFVAVNTPIGGLMFRMDASVSRFTIRASFVRYLTVGGQCFPGACNSGNHFHLVHDSSDDAVDLMLDHYGQPLKIFASNTLSLDNPDQLRSSDVRQHFHRRRGQSVLTVWPDTRHDEPVYVAITCEENTDSSFTICARPTPFSAWVWVALIAVYWAFGAAIAAVLVQPRRRQRPKSLKVAYGLWLTFGLLGAHRFYLNRRSTGTVWLFTAAAGGLGWLLDGFLLPTFVVECARELQYQKIHMDECDEHVIPMATLSHTHVARATMARVA